MNTLNWETLICFGDSITIGARSYCGYPEYCGGILEKSLDKSWNVINHAFNGYRAIDLLRSINGSFDNLKSMYPSIITVMIGTNDVKTNTSSSDFEIAFRQLLFKTRLLSINNNVVVFDIPGLTRKVFYPYQMEMNKKVDELNGIIRSVCSEMKLRNISLLLNEDDFFDGVHLSKGGSEKAASQLAQFILKDKGIEYSSALL